ncbi:NAD-dependent epimerase/dehydratase family protein [Enterovibrio norvegicus]|uniref:hypothetical protein n=1 Tax=Enterovibrio norvegicus TaxID=188144 RepID=UPI001E598A86|nr:hypothetical protein [Enterovibrio norvegicus]MCC4801062.1 hypothetical protein [Enterovibrio norvegicus]
MIVGNGQIASVFLNSKIKENSLIFASGVSDSSCELYSEFNREETLLRDCLNLDLDKKFIYFSSCALSSNDYSMNDYYRHKLRMEELIYESGREYLIVRIPQLFGRIKSHPTLINFLFNAINSSEEITVYEGAYRYLIYLEDLRFIVEDIFIEVNDRDIVDISNPYLYSVSEIVNTLEGVIKKTAVIRRKEVYDVYDVNFSRMISLLGENYQKYGFGKSYLLSKLKLAIQG